MSVTYFNSGVYGATSNIMETASLAQTQLG
jgi:hypothetical protein